MISINSVMKIHKNNKYSQFKMGKNMGLIKPSMLESTPANKLICLVSLNCQTLKTRIKYIRKVFEKTS